MVFTRKDVFKNGVEKHLVLLTQREFKIPLLIYVSCKTETNKKYCILKNMHNSALQTVE